MLIRSYVQSDLARITELTIETFRPFYEDSFRPLVGEIVFAIQHGKLARRLSQAGRRTP